MTPNRRVTWQATSNDENSYKDPGREVRKNLLRILCRGRLLAALAITIGSIIAGWTPATAATLTVGKAAPNADPIIPVNVGDKLGIFKKHGLDLTIVDFTGGSKMTQAHP